MLVVRLRQPKHLAPPKPHQRRCLGNLDPAIHQIMQHAHPVDLRPAHRNHRHRPNAPRLKLRRVTSLSGPTVTSLSGVYTASFSHKIETLRHSASLASRIRFPTGTSRRAKLWCEPTSIGRKPFLKGVAI